VSCACELILVYVVLYLVRGMHKFRLGLLQTEQLTSGDQGKVIDSVTETSVYDRKCMF